jgi:hypothetical protein
MKNKTMATNRKTIKKDGKVFHTLTQIHFGKDPVFALGKVEIKAPGSKMTEMYDKDNCEVIPNCLISIGSNGDVFVTISDKSNEPEIDMSKTGSKQRYYFTNTNHD